MTQIATRTPAEIPGLFGKRTPGRVARTATSSSREEFHCNPIWLMDTGKEWEEFLHLGHKMSFKSREAIPQFHSGQKGIYYLKYGKARVQYREEQRKESTLYYFGPGTMLYELSPDKQMLSYEVFAVTPVEAYFFPLADILDEQFAAQNPRLILGIINAQSMKNMHYMRRMITVVEGKAFANVCRLLLDLSRSCGNTCDLSLGITQEELASLLCVRRCWLGKILRRLKDEGVISRCTKSRLVISDMERLKAYAEQ